MGGAIPLRIGIVGAGAMGLSLGAIVSRFASVVMVCRNAARAAQIFEHAIRVDGRIEGRAAPLLVRSVGELADIGGVSYLFIATKTWSIPDVCAALAPVLDRIGAVGEAARIVSYQNGIDPGRQIMELLRTRRVMRMVLNYGAVLSDDGVVHVPMHAPPHYIGCLDDELIEDCRRLAGLFTGAGLETRYDEQIERHVWEKAVLNAAYNPVCALVNMTVGEVLSSPSGSVARALLEEGLAVARAEGIDLGDDYSVRAEAMIAQACAHLPSMVDDIRRGRPSEIGQLNRQIVTHARRLGVAVPTHETIDALIETFDWRVYRDVHRPV